VSRIYEVSQLVEKLSGIPIGVAKPLVGHNAFAHESGIHAHGVIKHTATYEPIQPERIGRQRTFVFGKHTGSQAVAEKLRVRGVESTQDQVVRLVALIKDFAEARSKTDQQAFIASFRERVERRVFYDPHPTTGVDRSLRRYIHTISYGKADLEAWVFPVATSPDADTVGAAMDSLPTGHGYTIACAVLLSGGLHRTGHAWWHATPRNGIEDYARVNLQEGLGAWAMELLHITTEFGDLYFVNPHLGKFDNMACFCGTHPSVHTKLAMQWLAPNTVTTHTHGRRTAITLHAVGLTQPPPPGRSVAIRIPSRTNSNHYMVEARLPVDDYERPSFASSGIPSSGVIVYEVAGITEVYLRTPQALQLGGTFTADGITVQVTGMVPGGFSVTVNSPEHPDCERLRAEIDALEGRLDGEEDPREDRARLSALQRARQRARALGCPP